MIIFVCLVTATSRFICQGLTLVKRHRYVHTFTDNTHDFTSRVVVS